MNEYLYRQGVQFKQGGRIWILYQKYAEKGYTSTRHIPTRELDMFNSHKMCIYSTHKHTPEAPRLRLIMPLTRDVSEDEYLAVARKVAQEIGMDMFDDTTYQPHRRILTGSDLMKCGDRMPGKGYNGFIKSVFNT